MKDPRYPFALDLGSEVGGYRIEAVLGAGGFGITYRARNDVTAKTVAIKEFYVRDISTRTRSTVVVDTTLEEGTYEFALGKFMEEAHAVVSRFDHPNIIKGENFLQANNTSYLIMDYVDGMSLEDWLQSRQTPPNEAELRYIFDQVFDAVDYVHANNTMHRDLTPRNIMLRSDGTPILIDFGAAGQGIDRGRSSKMVAQMRYAPPEQTDETGPGVHGRYTDIFSLGGVLYRAISGKAPMAPMTRLVRLGRKETAGVDPQLMATDAAIDPSLYSPQFLAGIDHALRLDEHERPGSIAELRATLGWADAAADGYPGLFDASMLAATVRRQPTGATATHPLPETVMVGRPGTAAGASPQRASAPPPPRIPTHSPLGDGRAPHVDQVLGTRRNIAARYAMIAAMIAGGAGLVLWPFYGDRLLRKPPPLISPYEFSIAVDGRAVTLSGHTPNGEEHKRLTGLVDDALKGRTLTDRLETGRGAPPVFADAAGLAIGLAGRLAEGQVILTDRALSVAGTVRALEDFVRIREARVSLPEGVTLNKLAVQARGDVPAQDCDRKAAPADHPDRPADVSGVPFDRIDPVGALVACTQAREAFPNVRRFALWIGRVHQRGNHFDEARAAYQLAADGGDPEGLAYSARLVETGAGTQQDVGAAFEIYLKAADQGSVLARKRLGSLLLGDNGYPPNPLRAMEWFRKGAEAGDADCMNQLGLLLEQGLGGPGQEGEALARFERAASLGLATASWNAAVLMDSGRVAEPDMDRAANLVLTALRGRVPGAIEALTGDMPGFSPEMRIAVKKRLKDEAGFAGALDAVWTADARSAALQLLR